MSVQENVPLVRRIFDEVFNQHSLAVVDELYAADFCYHAPRLPDLDREDLKQEFSAYLAAFPDTRVSVEDIFGAGDRVATRFTLRGTHQGEYMGVPPTGKPVTLTAILIQRLAGGKVVEDWEWPDNLGFLVQLGVVSLPE
jgi:steroid delta-isomerase-like uncharacterized protein